MLPVCRCGGRVVSLIAVSEVVAFQKFCQSMMMLCYAVEVFFPPPPHIEGTFSLFTVTFPRASLDFHFPSFSDDRPSSTFVFSSFFSSALFSKLVSPLSNLIAEGWRQL